MLKKRGEEMYLWVVGAISLRYGVGMNLFVRNNCK